MMKGPRNIHITDIMRYRFPLPAIASILHRISGIIVFLAIPFILILLHRSLETEQDFLLVKDFMGSFFMGLFIWIILSAMFYHLIAGIRHLIMDMGHLEDKETGVKGSLVVLILGVVMSLLIGVWIIC